METDRSFIDLDDGAKLDKLGWKPSGVVNRDRAKTQQLAEACWHDRAKNDDGGFSWWSFQHPAWRVAMAWSDAATQPDFSDITITAVTKLDADNAAVSCVASIDADCFAAVGAAAVPAGLQKATASSFARSGSALQGTGRRFLGYLGNGLTKGADEAGVAVGNVFGLAGDFLTHSPIADPDPPKRVRQLSGQKRFS